MATNLGFEYSYDRAGNRLQQRSLHDAKDSQRYAYDSANRLVSSSRGQYPAGTVAPGSSLYCDAPTTATYTDQNSAFLWMLDGAGNWPGYTSWKNSVMTGQTRIPNNFNGYYQIGATVQTYDANGNLIADGTHQFKWDALGRLREVRSSGATLIATYSYDADGRRVRKDLASGTDLDYLYDGWRMDNRG